MIQSKQDLKRYMEMDKIALRITKKYPRPLDFDDRPKDINLLVSGDQFADFMNFHAGDDPLSMPVPGSPPSMG